MNIHTLYGIFALVVWSTLALFVVWTGPVPPFLLGFLSFSIGSLCIFFVQGVRARDIKQLFRLPLRTYLFGSTGVGVYAILYYVSLKSIAPFVANSLNYLWPILLAGFLALLNKRRPRPEEIAGLLMGFSGTLMLFSHRYHAGDAQVADGNLVGYAAGIGAAVIWAIYSATARNVKYPSAATAVFFLISAVLSGILHLIFEKTVWPDGWQWFFVILLGAARLAYTSWDSAMKNGDREFLTSLSYFVPLASTLILVAFGHVPIDATVIVAGFIIIVGCLVTNVRKIRTGPVTTENCSTNI